MTHAGADQIVQSNKRVADDVDVFHLRSAHVDHKCKSFGTGWERFLEQERPSRIRLVVAVYHGR
jgi:hypothetical protein